MTVRDHTDAAVDLCDLMASRGLCCVVVVWDESDMATVCLDGSLRAAPSVLDQAAGVARKRIQQEAN